MPRAAALLTALLSDPDLGPRIGFSRFGLMGRSLDGNTVLAMAGGWPSWRTPQARAVVALSPYCQPFPTGGGLSEVGAAVLYQGGTRDRAITPAVSRPSGCYDQTAAPASDVEYAGAGRFAWTDMASPAHGLIAAYATAHFDAALKGEPWPSEAL